MLEPTLDDLISWLDGAIRSNTPLDTRILQHIRRVLAQQKARPSPEELNARIGRQYRLPQ